MTVKELIKKLDAYPNQNVPVKIWCSKNEKYIDVENTLRITCAGYSDDGVKFVEIILEELELKN